MARPKHARRAVSTWLWHGLAAMASLLALGACSPRVGGDLAQSDQPRDALRPPVLAAAELADLNRVPLAQLSPSRARLGQLRVPPRPRRTFTVVAVGDMMLGTNYPDPKYLPPDDGAALLAEVAPLLRSADLTVGNLEGTLLDEGGTPKRCQNPDACYAFRSPERYARHFAEAGFDFLSLANNHSGDFGPEGRLATKRNLDAHGIAYAGLLSTDELAFREVDGWRFGFVAFAPNSGTVDVRDLRRARELVAAAQAQADLVVVSFHGGAEGPDAQHVPRATETYFGEDRGDVYAFAHACVDAGADLVVGHGPHVTRGVELYRGRLIAYSLGNFATYGRFSLRGPAGVAPLLRARLDQSGEFVGGEVVPVYQTKPTGPHVDAAGRATRLVRDLSAADFPESPLLIEADGTLRRAGG